MKTRDFLNKLAYKKVIELTEESIELMDAYMKKSSSNLESAKILLENNRLEESIALTYYSMYNATLSLMFRTGIKSENHNATIQILKTVFEIDNIEILNAKEERIDKQYYVDFSITKKETEEAIKKAEEFNAKILDFTIKLTTDKIQKYKEKFRAIITKLKEKIEF